MTTKLLKITSDRYLRRLSKAINAQRYSQPMHVTLAGCNETRRIRSSRFAGRMLQVRTIGSDMWFPVYSAEQITGVCASRVVRSNPTLAHEIRQQITAGVCGPNAPTKHPDGCSCGSPECPQWAAAQERA